MTGWTTHSPTNKRPNKKRKIIRFSSSVDIRRGAAHNCVGHNANKIDKYTYEFVGYKDIVDIEFFGPFSIQCIQFVRYDDIYVRKILFFIFIFIFFFEFANSQQNCFYEI